MDARDERRTEPDPVQHATPAGQENHPEVERSGSAPKLGIVLGVALAVIAAVLLLEVLGFSLAR
jgi:hypothetical protein